MARKEVVELTDDLDGSPASQTIYFAVGGVEYEIDLNERNIKKFHAALEPFIEKGRRVSRKPAIGHRSGLLGGADPRTIRQWANEQGIEISTRGRIPAEIVHRYTVSVGG